MLQIVINNPYRILGVYTNSAKRDVVANKGRATAFLKVNRPVEYPLDLKGILPPITRTLDSMNEAEAHLVIAKEQIKYAQFWFVKITPIDDIAFNHLLAGNMEGAKEMWSKQDSVSSLQNKIVCYLIEDNLSLAVKTAERLYEEFGDNYVSRIDANCTLQISSAELLHQFVDTLGEEVGMQKLLDYKLGDETKAYICNQAVGPLINKISSEVEKAKKVDHKDPNARINAARKLVINTKEPFGQLKSLLPSSDPQFQMIADKLGLEILQCGIDYFNNSEEDEAPHTAMKMQKYAQSLVVGLLAKQRCEENVRILQGIIDKLPPKSVTKEYNNLQKLITLFALLPSDVDSIIKFLSDTCSVLVSIKEKLGKEHPFYRKEATNVAQIALNKSIDAFNKIQEEEFPKLNGINRTETIETIKHALAKSWEAMLWLELVETDDGFKENRLNPNKSTLKSILERVEAFDEDNTILRILDGRRYSVFVGCARGISVDKYMYFTEGEMYLLCRTIYGCEEYLKKYPHGEHVSKVRVKLTDLKDDEKFRRAKTLSEYNNYLITYPEGRHVDEAKEKIHYLQEEERKRIEKEKAQLLEKIKAGNSINACTGFKIECLKYKSPDLWRALDDKFFSLCHDIKDYESYINELGINASHKDEAKKKIKEKKNKQKLLKLLLFLVILVVICLGAFLIISEHNKQIQRQNQIIYNNYQQLLSAQDPDKCISFIKNYPNCADSLKSNVKVIYKSAILQKADSLINNCDGDLNSLQAFIDKYRNVVGFDSEEAIDKVAEKYSDEKERLKEIERMKKQQEEYEKYGTDANAWKTASRENTINSYKKYLEQYPNGSHRAAAEKKIIDLEVADVYAGEHSALPPMDQVGYGEGTRSSIEIYNNTPYTLTVLYSGPESRRIVISQHQRKEFYMKNGSYRIAASVSASGVRNCAGTESLRGGNYSVEYYIRTTTY